MRKHSLATIAAAVVAAAVLVGGAAAASKYIITSTNQIKPSVLKKFQPALAYQDHKGPIANMCAAGTDTTGQCEVAASDSRCPGGSIATGGGFDGGSAPPVRAAIGYTEPDSDGHGWHIIMGNAGPSNETFQTVAVCLGVSRAAFAAQAGAPSRVRAQIGRELASMRTRR
jgi:hypothetical protein